MRSEAAWVMGPFSAIVQSCCGCRTLRPRDDERSRVTATRWSQADVIYLSQATAGLQGHSLWGNQLDRLGDGEYFHGVCPACEAELETELGIAPGHLRLDGSRTHTTISPIDVMDLDGIGLQLHELASKAGHPEVARRLRDVFGQAPCPACGERIAVDEAIAIADA